MQVSKKSKYNLFILSIAGTSLRLVPNYQLQSLTAPDKRKLYTIWQS